MSDTSKKRGRPKTVNDQTSKPWSIRGVNNETREKAKAAAKREGVTIGDWIDRALTEAAHQSLGTGGKTTEVGPTIEDMMTQFMSDFAKHQEEQKSQMEAMSQEVKEVREYQSQPWYRKLTQ